MFAFFDVEDRNAPQHPMFREDTMGLPVKLTLKKLQDSPIKRKATGKRTEGKLTQPQRTPMRGLKLSTESKTAETINKQTESDKSSSSDDSGSSTSEITAPSPKRVNK